MKKGWKLIQMVSIVLIVMLLSACKGSTERNELTNYIGKSVSTFERKSGIDLNELSSGVYQKEDVLQVMTSGKEVSAVTLLGKAEKYKVFGVTIGMKKEEADSLLVDNFGTEIAKKFGTDQSTVTYSYLKNENELYITYDSAQETVIEISYYKSAAPKQEEDDTSVSSGNLMASIGDTRVYYNEVMVYLKLAQEKYEKEYGKGIWQADILGNGNTFGSMLKEEVIHQLTELKIIKAEALKKEINLTEEELAEAASYAKDHFESLKQEEIDQYLITKELLTQVYADNLLASKMFEMETINVDNNVTEEAAKQITVLDIVVYSSHIDLKGNKVTLSEEEKADAYEKIQNLAGQAKETTDFLALAEANSEADTIEYTFGKGEAPKEYGDVFEQAAFQLKTGEVSDIIATENGWHIIYCVSDYNEDATIQVKERIIGERRNEMFMDIFSEWSEDYDVVINEEAWNKISFED